MHDRSLRVPLAADENGTLRVEGKGVSFEEILQTYERGATAEEIVDVLPSLTLAEVYAVLSYYLQNPRQVETYRLRHATAAA